ncbi:MAG: SH3 domain-containing protein [Nitrosomonas sp.]
MSTDRMRSFVSSTSISFYSKVQLPLRNSMVRKVSALIVIAISGCVIPEKEATIPEEKPQQPIISENEQHLKKEVARLEKLVAEKDALIKNQKVRQIDQANVIRETNKEATRTQVKLHRLATKPGTASAIAELETTLAQLKQEKTTAFDRVLTIQAQHLLETSTAFYSKDQYATAMNHVSQANNFVRAIRLDPKMKKVSHMDYPQLDFHIPVELRATKNFKLYKSPDTQSKILLSVKKDTILKAIANEGAWLKVLIDTSQGWIENTGFKLD